MTRKYFGTDGIRGRVGEAPITADFFLKLGWAAGTVLTRNAVGKKRVLIGKDTRVSGYMFESALEAGLIAAGQANDYMICLADLPLLTTADCAALCVAHKKAGVGQITVPVQRKDGIFVRRGNPIIIPASARHKIIKEETNLGCRGLLDNHPNLIYPFDSCANGFYVDIDTQDAFRDTTGQKPDARMIAS